MNIILNGAPESIQDPSTLAELVQHLDLPGKRYAIEVNEQLIPRSQHPQYKVLEGDKVEIVQAIGGG